jgi:hypothetical protein
LCAAATKGLQFLADKGYCSAGIGIHAPITNPAGDQVLDVNNRCYNSLLTRLRCLAERAAAILLTRWKTLRRITLRHRGSAPSPKLRSYSPNSNTNGDIGKLSARTASRQLRHRKRSYGEKVKSFDPVQEFPT